MLDLLTSRSKQFIVSLGLHERFSKRNIADQVEEMDADNSGFVTHQEYFQFIFENEGEYTREHEAEFNRLASQSSVDKSVISIQKVAEQGKYENFEDFVLKTEATLLIDLKAMDRNNDGFISEHEWKVGELYGVKGEDLPSEVAHWFGEYFGKKDGKVPVQKLKEVIDITTEIVKNLLSLKQQLTSSSIGKIMGFFDLNKDKKISLMEAQPVFAISPVTKSHYYLLKNQDGNVAIKGNYFFSKLCFSLKYIFFVLFLDIQVHVDTLLEKMLIEYVQDYITGIQNQDYDNYDEDYYEH